GLPRRAWEPDETGGIPGEKPGRTQVLFPRSNAPHSSFQRSAFLVPTLCVGTQRYQQGLPRRAWEPVRPIQTTSSSSFPRSAWERNGTSKDYHAERGSQLFQRSAFLVPMLRVGT